MYRQLIIINLPKLVKKAGIKYCFIIVLSFLHFNLFSQSLNPNKELAQYTSDSWGSDNGLISGGTLDVLQSEEGYIWLGTFNGVYRFDGITFKHFSKDLSPEITNNSIPTITLDDNGNVWAGSIGGGIYIFKNQFLRKFTEKDGLSSNVIRKLYTDSKGRILIGTGDGLTIYSDSTFTTFKDFKQGSSILTNVTVSALYEDSQGQIWVGTNLGLFKLINNELIEVPLAAKKYGDIEVSSIIESEDNRLFIGTYGHGIFIKEKDSIDKFEIPDGINKISNLMFDSNGAFWIAHQNGLLRFYKNKFSTLPPIDGVSEDAVEGIIEDTEGSIWFTRYNGGLERLRDGIFINYTTFEGLDDNKIHCIYEDKDSSKWIGTSNGLNHFYDGEFTYYNTDNGFLKGNLVRDVYRDSQDVLWIATYNGLTKIENDKIDHFSTLDGLSSNQVRLIYEDSNGLLWFGTRNGLNTYKNGIFKTYSIEDGLPNNFILSIHERVPGELWIGTSGGGIGILKDGQFSNLTTKDGLASDIVFRIHQDEENVLWIATNNGLSRYKNGKIFSGFNTDNGFLNTAIFQVLEDAEHELWITSNSGIIKVKKEDINNYIKNQNEIKEINYKQVDGLKRSECTPVARSLKAKDGTLWFATLGGVAVVDIKDNLINKTLPNMLVEELIVDQEKIAIDNKDFIEMPLGSKNIEIKYTGLSLKIPEKVKFKYILEGYDNEWVNANKRRTAYYTNLPHGDYTFKVIAANNDGLWSKVPAEISFRILPKFYETKTFFFIVVLVFLLLVFGIYHFRLRTIKKEQVRLQQLVDDRTSEIQSQNEEISAQRDEIELRSKRLEEAQDIIKKQNLQLTKSNLKLEDTVNIRTRQLEISNSKLQEKNRELDLFIYKSAHDLRGPIARIRGLSQLGLTDLEPESQQLYFKKLNFTANKMNDMLSRIIRVHEINGHEIALSPVKIHDLVNSIIQRLAIPDGLVENGIVSDLIINYDKYLLDIVLENLINNAYKFRRDNSEEQFIRINMFRSKDTIEILISNNGQIIPTDMQAKIFDIFTVANDQYDGAGLGLYEAKVIMSKMGGNVKLLKSDIDSTDFLINLGNICKI